MQLSLSLLLGISLLLQDGIGLGSDLLLGFCLDSIVMIKFGLIFRISLGFLLSKGLLFFLVFILEFGGSLFLLSLFSEVSLFFALLDTEHVLGLDNFINGRHVAIWGIGSIVLCVIFRVEVSKGIIPVFGGNLISIFEVFFSQGRSFVRNLLRKLEVHFLIDLLLKLDSLSRVSGWIVGKSTQQNEGGKVIFHIFIYYYKLF